MIICKDYSQKSPAPQQTMKLNLVFNHPEPTLQAGCIPFNTSPQGRLQALPSEACDPWA